MKIRIILIFHYFVKVNLASRTEFNQSSVLFFNVILTIAQRIYLLLPFEPFRDYNFRLKTNEKLVVTD